MNEELKPCPFCGGIAELHEYSNDFFVKCTCCGIMTREYAKCDFCEKMKCVTSDCSESLDEARERAIKDWNRRTGS